MCIAFLSDTHAHTHADSVLEITHSWGIRGHSVWMSVSQQFRFSVPSWQWPSSRIHHLLDLFESGCEYCEYRFQDFVQLATNSSWVAALWWILKTHIIIVSRPVLIGYWRIAINSTKCSTALGKTLSLSSHKEKPRIISNARNVVWWLSNDEIYYTQLYSRQYLCPCVLYHIYHSDLQSVKSRMELWLLSLWCHADRYTINKYCPFNHFLFIFISYYDYTLYIES